MPVVLAKEFTGFFVFCRIWSLDGICRKPIARKKNLKVLSVERKAVLLQADYYQLEIRI